MPLAQLTAYTTALQTDLQRAGYDPGPIDGIYGPQTVAAVEKLQTDSGLPVTGFVDEATARALQDKLDAVGQQAATQTAALQTVLTLAGFWDGPIDGQWTDALTQALMDLQTTLGVEPTGQVDAATVAAFQQALAALATTVTSATTATPRPRDHNRHRNATATTTATATATAPATRTGQHPHRPRRPADRPEPGNLRYVVVQLRARSSASHLCSQIVHSGRPLSFGMDDHRGLNGIRSWLSEHDDVRSGGPGHDDTKIIVVRSLFIDQRPFTRRTF